LRIGFDITALYVAQAGVFTFDYHLLRALLNEGPGNEYLLLDYEPLRGRRPRPAEGLDLEDPNASVVRCRGLRHRRLSRWKVMQRPALRPLAGWVDGVLFRPWAAAAEASMRRRLPPVLAGVDVFHSSDVLLWRQPGALNCVTVYDLTPLLFPEYHTAETLELHRRKVRFVQEEADLVIAISEATKRDVVAHLGVVPERVHVVYGGVDPAFRLLSDRRAVAQALAPLGLRPDGYILYVGTIEPRKNLVRLIEAYGRARRMLPSPAPDLVVAGASGWQSREVFARAEALELGSAVRFVGRVPLSDLPALYNGALLFVYPSLYEGFGLPPLEAMACGTAVLTSDAAALPEVVGEAGITVDPRDVQQIAARMVALLSDEGLRQRLGELGRARAARFGWDVAARRVLQLYGAFVQDSEGGARPGGAAVSDAA
jgi:glycosyltransferase involved in cell wall biosynthesis